MLLTLVTPQEQQSRQEEQSLISKPVASWTVLVINGPVRPIGSRSREPQDFLTPVAQYIRGVCSTVYSQRFNILPIFQELKEQFNAADTETLFDDEEFSKS